MAIGSATPVSTPILADRITTIRAGPVGLVVDDDALFSESLGYNLLEERQCCRGWPTAWA